MVQPASPNAWAQAQRSWVRHTEEVQPPPDVRMWMPPALKREPRTLSARPTQSP
jgi:hypothetical protein